MPGIGTTRSQRTIDGRWTGAKLTQVGRGPHERPRSRGVQLQRLHLRLVSRVRTCGWREALWFEVQRPYGSWLPVRCVRVSRAGAAQDTAPPPP